MATKICPTCGKEFGKNRRPSVVKGQTYCSMDCYIKRSPHICRTCGKTFFGGEKDAKYCSRDCQNNAGRKSLKCPQCGTVFTVRKSSKRIYCSRQCSADALTPKRQKQSVYICKYCGKTFKEKTCRNSQYCSISCAAIDRGLHHRGENNPHYKGGTIRTRGENWGTQRYLALKRDAYTCQICGSHRSPKVRIAVHHIKPYREFNGNWKRANELSNLITLCRSCHMKVEHFGLPCPIHLF